MSEQITLLKGCEKLVVISGTLAHNILFADDGIDLTILNRSNTTNAYQPLINEARKARVNYVDTHISIFPVFANGPFLLNINDNLLRYAKDNNLLVKHNRVNPIKLQIFFVWYLLKYIDNMNGHTVRCWRLGQDSNGDFSKTMYIIGMS